MILLDFRSGDTCRNVLKTVELHEVECRCAVASAIDKQEQRFYHPMAHANSRAAHGQIAGWKTTPR